MSSLLGTWRLAQTSCTTCCADVPRLLADVMQVMSGLELLNQLLSLLLPPSI